MSEGTTAAAFAALLGELKERSGLSYGVLAKRLHMSTSTLHRYCNGDAVPTDYAPVERLARLCKASPEELVELHRRWVLADAGRVRKGSGGGTGNGVSGGVGSGGPAAGSGASGVSSPEVPPTEVTSTDVTSTDVTSTEAASSEAGVLVPKGATSEADVPEPSEPAGRPRPRRALLVGVAAAVVLGGVGLAVAVPSGGSDDEGRRGAAAASGGGGGQEGKGTAASVSPSAGSSAGREDKDKSKDGKGKGKQTASESPTSASPGTGTGKGSGAGGTGRDNAPASAPLTVDTEPHAWESPCSQRYLIDLPPGRVGPPPPEQDAPGWVAANGAVPSGEQFLKLTVQGKGQETVVVKRLTVRMAGKRAPLAWNDYAMGYPGVGCGGGVPTRFFTVALDAARPGVVPEAGHANFPFKVSESDPEVYYIRADASAYEVSWYLELAWSSGDRTGTLTVDDHGRPFRTSGNNGRPAYEFPLGGEKWVEEGTTQ
ncbi:Helix-turn-helix domain-containing protein [Streptomyces sp. Ag82_O1-12]|uniref:helix-turn-helix domain-containing protein n=1 Tax=unclassified Streptomyces TaxID=2593676 RepID=UPI000BDA7C15|nr:MULTISPECIES: helix-turn-helix transcriptional regulator [unclassified Streptomyces]SMQ18041.1 Helix-turn-helix domain-containing protein [Streptomyces sp. Ag82_O1-12]SOD47078.1 Helix-turn-helix domain-containing protein [Streptomyces sp. Ag82_G6-1]